MATPETRSVELDPLAPSFDRDPNTVEREAHRVVAAETRELPAYGFESADKTLVGIGTSGSADSSTVCCDSHELTLVGIGPAERAKRAERAKTAEFASHSRQLEAAPESVPMPQSEPPGPFIAGGDERDAAARLPTKKSGRWALASSAVLVAAAAVALLRGAVPHSAAPRLHSATTAATLPPKTPTRDVRFETAAATLAETSAFERPIAEASETQQPSAPPAMAQAEKQPKLAPRHASANSAGREPLGALDLTSNPPSSLVLDGRPVGKAPCVIEVPSGPHTVLFVHPDRGRMAVTVNVRGGHTTSASAVF